MTPKEAIDKLLMAPERYVFGHADESYANGYVDALLDLCRELGIT